jgi:hypothetical protein
MVSVVDKSSKNPKSFLMHVHSSLFKQCHTIDKVIFWMK